jgi:hypothetical protein
MEDVTNYLMNIDKPKEEQKFLLRLSYAELWAFKGLAQNTHPAHLENRELMQLAESMFYKSKEILDRVNQRELDRE